MSVKAEDIIDTLYICDLDGNLEKVINKLQQYQLEFIEKYDSLKLEVTCNYDNEKFLSLVGIREETIKETIDRITKEELSKKKHEEREKDQYLKLKQKFEKGE